VEFPRDRLTRLILGIALAGAVSGCGSRVLFRPESCARGAGLSATPLLGSSLSEKQVALTFMGGPGDESATLADFLFASNVRATFFVVGENADSRKSTLEVFRDRGHLVANAGWTNRALSRQRDAVQSLRRVDWLISPWVTGNIFLMRAPEGGFDSSLAAALNEGGLSKYTGPVGFDLGAVRAGNDVSDLRCQLLGTSPQACAGELLDATRLVGKGIVQIHDTFPGIVQLVRTYVTTLQDEGWSFVSLDSVPDIRVAITANGGTPGALRTAGGCDDY
jgi:peptidoglycan/xylan/chitin deacetylase (PgdA/CDA1 family)